MLQGEGKPLNSSASVCLCSQANPSARLLQCHGPAPTLWEREAAQSHRQTTDPGPVVMEWAIIGHMCQRGPRWRDTLPTNSPIPAIGTRTRRAAPGRVLLELQHPGPRSGLSRREACGEQTAGPGRDVEPRQRQEPVRSTARPRQGPAGRGEERWGGRWRRAPRRSGRGGRTGCLRAAMSGGGERGIPGAWGPRGGPEGVCQPRYSRGG